MRINVELQGHPQAQATFNRMLKAGADFTPAMRQIGETLLNSTRQRFADEEAPDGSKWPDLSPVTKARKQSHADRILHESGALSGSINYRADSRSVSIGSTREYAGTHQFGALQGSYGRTSRNGPIPWGDIPPRPYLGLSQDDQSQITKILLAHIHSQT